MSTVHVDASVSYDIIIQRGILGTCGEAAMAVTGKCSAAVVSDDIVFPLYGEKVMKSLEKAGYTNLTSFVIKNGEDSKNLSSFGSLINHLAANGYTRGDVVFALGGGVVGDLTGFAASCYLRGIKFIQIPTTLLSAVDSSVGGKTAVDIPQGKNLVGTFHQPSLVICDPDTLDTLPDEIFACGMAEVIKYGMINDRALFDLLSETDNPKNEIEKIIELCVSDKAAIVKEDEFDTGARALLNLGHTIGHGVEALSHFEVMHGQAVAIGMAIIARAANKKGMLSTEDLDSLTAMLKKNRLPISTVYSADELYKKSLSDKKRSGGSITLIVPYGIADSRLVKVDVTEVPEWIKLGLEK